jgi:hypothetical protein
MLLPDNQLDTVYPKMKAWEFKLKPILNLQVCGHVFL